MAHRPRGTFLLQLDEKRALYPPEQGLPRGGGLCPLPRPARAFALNHASCPGYFLPCFSIFALPRRTLKGGQGGTIRRFPLLLSLPFQRERKNKKAISILVQTHLETVSLLSSIKNLSFSEILPRNVNPAPHPHHRLTRNEIPSPHLLHLA